MNSYATAIHLISKKSSRNFKILCSRHVSKIKFEEFLRSRLAKHILKHKYNINFAFEKIFNYFK